MKKTLVCVDCGGLVTIYGKRCQSCKNKHFIEKNRESHDASQFRYRLKSVYGITPEQYYEMLDRQGGVCAICGQPEKIAGRRLAIDHDHSCCPGKSNSCGKFIRGLLCSRCNTAIGLFEDDTDLMTSALSYV